ncbi:MDIS1-interacting receptor like kinase 2-like protein, partial [Tanacetum coccineum]
KIPVSFANLIRLENLDLSYNNLTGKIHFLFANITCLEYIDLSKNNFTGILPTRVVRLKNLDLSRNNFIGQIPSSFGSMVNLTYLDLSTNQLIGTIPPALITNLHQLETLDLSNNNLHGAIPSSANLYVSFTSLRELNLSHNNFNVFIPSQLVRLRYLVTVDFSQNQLTGSIPSYFDSMVNLTTLVYLSFRGNLLTGKLPVWLTNLTQLINLDLSRNNFTDLIPPSFISMVNLNVLDLSDNNLDGPIPSSFGNLSQLKFLNLAMNCISGPIPLDITYLMKLSHLDLHHNHLVGDIHPEFGKLSYLSYLDFSSNQLSGNVSLANPCSLLNLNLSQNLMTGAITSVRGCRNLEYLDITEMVWSSNNSWSENGLDELAVEVDCNPPIVHRDISSNNILLNSEMEGFVADIGAARLLDPDSSNQTVIAELWDTLLQAYRKGNSACLSSGAVMHTHRSKGSANNERSFTGTIALRVLVSQISQLHHIMNNRTFEVLHIEVTNPIAFEQRLNTICIGTQKVHYNIARHQRRPSQSVVTTKTHHHHNPPKPYIKNPTGVTYADVITGNKNQSNRHIMNLPTPVSPASYQHPSNSVIAELKSAKGATNTHNLIRDEGFEDFSIKYLGGLFLLLNLRDNETTVNILSNTTLASYFKSLVPWTNDFLIQDRVTWLAISGLPPKMWTPDTFTAIANHWGDVIVLEDCNPRQFNRTTGRVCILT